MTAERYGRYDLASFAAYQQSLLAAGWPAEACVYADRYEYLERKMSERGAFGGVLGVGVHGLTQDEHTELVGYLVQQLMTKGVTPAQLRIIFPTHAA